MIREETITNFKRTDAELEEVLLFWILVAGKEANMMALKLEQLLNLLRSRYGTKFDSPFELLIHAIERDTLMGALKEVRMGKYALMEEAFRHVVRCIDPRTATLEELESVPGIGPKTARAFLMHSRPNQRLAALDTHLLKFLRAMTDDPTIPKTTPPAGKRYRELEQRFLEIADELKASAADLDLAVWKAYAGRGVEDLERILRVIPGPKQKRQTVLAA